MNCKCPICKVQGDARRKAERRDHLIRRMGVRMMGRTVAVMNRAIIAGDHERHRQALLAMARLRNRLERAGARLWGA